MDYLVPGRNAKHISQEQVFVVGSSVVLVHHLVCVCVCVCLSVCVCVSVWAHMCM